MPAWNVHLALGFATLLLMLVAPVPSNAEENQTVAKPQNPVADQQHGSRAGGTADHSKFKVLEGPFLTGSDVTRACLTCHTEAGKHFMKSIH
ncbi:MAG: hypothetical protein KDJ45_00520 [Hyphomicrobiaceae bacterium]|nr:hypothetical protein [Hyphomicrobiaceae bacterium]